MRRIMTVLLCSLALALTGAGPATSADEAAPKPCGEPIEAGELAEGIRVQAPRREVSPFRAVGTAPCEGVRPGGYIEIPLTRETRACTLNFLFIGRDRLGRKHVYMGTAGHCILGDGPQPGHVGERSWQPGKGPRVEDGFGRRIGEFAYAALIDKDDVVRDFALVRIDAGVRVNPQMCWFGGPTGVNDDRTNRTVTLHHYGHGLGIGMVTPARSSVAFGMPDGQEIYAMGVVIPGDSGGAAISSDGRAVGVVVTTGAHFRLVSLHDGTVGITRLTPQLQQAAKVLGQRLTLVTAPLA